MDNDVKIVLIITTALVFIISIIMGAILYEDLNDSLLETCMEDCFVQNDITMTSKCKIACVEKLKDIEIRVNIGSID